ncbi:hypothetical protein GCM10028805_54490 [Spirosoma harenae]
MENDQIIQKILLETTALMPLKVDNEDVVQYKFKHIKALVSDLHSLVTEDNEKYLKAFNLMQAAINEEYKHFVVAASYDEKEQALIQLKHKAAEVSGMLQAG